MRSLVPWRSSNGWLSRCAQAVNQYITASCRNSHSVVDSSSKVDELSPHRQRGSDLKCQRKNRLRIMVSSNIFLPRHESCGRGGEIFTATKRSRSCRGYALGADENLPARNCTS